jgi:hypothetical protein
MLPNQRASGARWQPPADDLVYGVLALRSGLHRDPGVHAEHAAPTDDAGRVDLDDRLCVGRGIGREPHRFLACGAPILRVDPADHGRTERDRACHGEKSEDDTHATPH